MDECFLSESTKAALTMMSCIGVDVLECIVVDELCEFHGRQKVEDTGTDVRITSLVKTTSADAIS